MPNELYDPDTPELQAKFAETLTAVGIEISENEKKSEVSKGGLLRFLSIPSSNFPPSTNSSAI